MSVKIIYRFDVRRNILLTDSFPSPIHCLFQSARLQWMTSSLDGCILSQSSITSREVEEESLKTLFYTFQSTRLQRMTSSRDVFILSPSHRLPFTCTCTLFQSARLQRMTSSRDGRILSPSHRLPPMKTKKKVSKRCFICAKKTGLACSYTCRWGYEVCALLWEKGPLCHIV